MLAYTVPRLSFIRTLTLAHAGDCALLGVDASGRVAVEEIYEDWWASYLFDTDGQLLASADEDSGANANPSPLPDLVSFQAPPKVERAAALNYTVGRWRGLREEDRLLDLVQPLTVAEKMALGPGSTLGLAESYVLAESALTPQLSLICRRVRIARAVPLQRDTDGLPYDYDTTVLYLLQWIDPTADPIEAPLDRRVKVQGLALARPMDLFYADRTLYVAEGGDAASGRNNSLHILSVELPGTG